MTKFSHIVFRNSAIGMAAQGIIKLLSFAFSVLIVRSLGARDYGQYAAILAFGAVFVFLADLGLSPYAVHEVARLRAANESRDEIEALLGNVLILRFLLALVTALVVIAAAWLTGRPTEMIVAIALGTIGLVMYSAEGTAEAFLSGYERLDLVSGAKVFYQLIFVLLGAVALLLGAGYFGLIGANLVGIAFISIFCWQRMRSLGIRPATFQWRRWVPLLRAGIPFGVIGFTLGLSYKFDSILLNVFQGDQQTGYYSAAYTLIFAVIMLSNVLNTALYPSLARQAVTDPGTLPGSMNECYAI